MKMRNELLSAIVDIRGRLDELEAMVRASPGGPVWSPASFDEPGVEAFTPAAYSRFRSHGLPEKDSEGDLRKGVAFVRVNASDGSRARYDEFELSPLHKLTPEREFGLEIVPDGPNKEWMNYEFVTDAAAMAKCEWLEWVLKVSAGERFAGNLSFSVTGPGFVEKIPFASVDLHEFASFVHARVSMDSIAATLGERQATQFRLLLGTGGRPVRMRLYGLGLYGRVRP